MSRMVFPNINIFVDDVLSGLVEKTIFTYVHPTLVNCILAIYTFDLWMSKGVHDVFVIVVNFLSSKWEAKHVIIKLFEVFNINGVNMVPRFQQLLDKFFFPQMILPYVNDENFNL